MIDEIRKMYRCLIMFLVIVLCGAMIVEVQAEAVKMKEIPYKATDLKEDLKFLKETQSVGGFSNAKVALIPQRGESLGYLKEEGIKFDYLGNSAEVIITKDIFVYDVLILETYKPRPYPQEVKDILKEFVASGHGLLLISGVPHQNLLGSRDLTGFTYINDSGPVHVAVRCYITQDVPENMTLLKDAPLHGPCAAGCKAKTAMPILVFDHDPSKFTVSTNVYESGRVGFFGGGDEPVFNKIFLRMLIWCANPDISDKVF